jgi:hypothetical protein
VRLHELYEQYYQQVQFLSIYIREAHPIDGWWLGRRLTRSVFRKFFPKASMTHYDPKTMEERRAVAGECEMALQYGIRTYIDEMDDDVNTSYAAWPTRLDLIGLDGRVVYAGGLGPYGMKLNELKEAIDHYLPNISQARLNPAP